MARPGRRLSTVLVPLVVLALTLGAGWWANGREADTRSALTSALDALPAGTVAAGFTDWMSVRRDLGVGSSNSAAAQASLSDDASLQDLSTRSALAGSIDTMRPLYGWSAVDLEWESYGQAPGGSALVAKLRSSVSFDTVRERLSALGYTQRGDTWVIGDEAQAAVGQELSASLASVVLLPRDRLVVAANDPTYVTKAVATVRGSAPSLLSVRGALDVATSLAGSDTALLETGQQSCPAASLVGQDADVQAQAVAAVARAGALATPGYTGRGLALGPDGRTMVFAFSFDSPVVAARQAQVRATLASGPFIGRGGRVEDSLVLVSTGVSGSAGALRFDLDPDRGAYMSGEGPVLFASCPA